MKRHRVFRKLFGAITFALSLFSISGACAEAPTHPISFIKDIAPIFTAKCQTCHNAEKAKGGYRLENFETLMKPGDSKEPPIVPAHPEKSKLYELITTTDPDDRMPQKADPLAAGQLALIEGWIRQGALFDGTNRSTPFAVFAAGASRVDTPTAYPQPGPILALAFHPSGEELAASGYGEVNLWDARDGELRRRIGQLPQKIQALAFTDDGKTLAVGGGSPGISGEAILIKTGDPARRHVLGNFSDIVLDLQFARGDQRVATAGADNSIRIYDVQNGRQQLLIQQHADWVTGIAFSHDGKRIASSSRDRTCRVFDTTTGELETTYVGHEAPVLALVFSSNDKSVCSAGRDKKIHVWSVKDAKKTNDFVAEGEIVRLISNGDHVFSCGSDKIVREYDLSESKPRRTFSGHTDWIYSIAIDAPRHRLATGAFDGEVRLLDLQSGDLITRFIAAPGFQTRAVNR